LCDCGNKRSFQLSRIISGHTTSCGCYKTEFLRNKKLSDETKKKISVNHSRHNLGKKFSVETRKKISIAGKGRITSEKTKKLMSETQKKNRLSSRTYFKKNAIPWNKNMKMPEEFRKKVSIGHKGINSGEKAHQWIKDRSKVKTGDRDLNDPLQKQWRRGVKNRDNWKCKINNQYCKGRLEAHHILPWKDHPELRYDINNGITLCHAHHPRKKDEVAKLSPFFKSLVASLD
jgi:hypothetical protein